MVLHSRERFTTIVAGLNKAFEGFMIFQLAGSLTDKPASQHDADIIVYPRLAFDMNAFSKGCKDAGIQIVAVDTTSNAPFPGRPNGQDRIQVKMRSGEVIDLFFPKGSLEPKQP
jgi:hypothetical protein